MFMDETYHTHKHNIQMNNIINELTKISGYINDLQSLMYKMSDDEKLSQSSIYTYVKETYINQVVSIINTMHPNSLQDSALQVKCEDYIEIMHNTGTFLIKVDDIEKDLHEVPIPIYKTLNNELCKIGSFIDNKIIFTDGKDYMIPDLKKTDQCKKISKKYAYLI